MQTDRLTDETFVEVSHEALLQQWTQLEHWLSEARSYEHVKERIRNDAKLYDPSEKDTSSLTLQGIGLEQAKALADLRPPRLTDHEMDFVRKCWKHQQDKQNKKFRYAIKAIVVLGGLLMFSIIAFEYARRQSIAALHSKAESDQSLMALETTSAIAARDENQFVRAAQYFAKAGDLHDNSMVKSAFHFAANQNLALEFVSRTKHNSPLLGGEILNAKGRTISWSDNGSILVNTGNNSDELISFRHPALVGVAINNANDKAVSFGGDRLRFWDLNTGIKFSPEQSQSKVKGGAFLHNRIVSWSNDKTTNEKIKVWGYDGKHLFNLKIFESGDPLSGVEIDLERDTFWAWSTNANYIVEVSFDPDSEQFYKPNKSISFPENIRGVIQVRGSNELLVYGKSHVKRFGLESETFRDIVSRRDGISGAAADNDLTFVWGYGNAQIFNPNWTASPPREIEDLQHVKKTIAIHKERREETALIAWSQNFNKVFVADGNITTHQEIEHDQSIMGVAMVGEENLITWDSGGTVKFSNLLLKKQIAEVVHEKGIVKVASLDDLVMTMSNDGFSKLWKLKPRTSEIEHLAPISGSTVGQSLMTWGMASAEDDGSLIVEISERKFDDLVNKSHILTRRYADTGIIRNVFQLQDSIVIHDSRGVHLSKKNGQDDRTILPIPNAKLLVGKKIAAAWTTNQLILFSSKKKPREPVGLFFDVAIAKDDVVTIATEKGIVRNEELVSGDALSNLEDIKVAPDGEFALAKCRTESGGYDFYVWSMERPNWNLLEITPLQLDELHVDSDRFFIFGKVDASEKTIIMYGTFENPQKSLATIEVSRNVRQLKDFKSQDLLAVYETDGFGFSTIGIFDTNANELVGEIEENNAITEIAFSKFGLAFTSTGKRCSLWELNPTNQLLVLDYDDVESTFFHEQSLVIFQGNGNIETMDFSERPSQIESEIQAKTDTKLLKGGMIINK